MRVYGCKVESAYVSTWHIVHVWQALVVIFFVPRLDIAIVCLGKHQFIKTTLLYDFLTQGPRAINIF